MVNLTFLKEILPLFKIQYREIAKSLHCGEINGNTRSHS